MLKNFKKGFNGDYGVKLTPGKLRTIYEIDWLAFGVGWPLERSLGKVIVNRVFEVIVGDPGHPDQFPYIDCWQDAVLSWPTWLKPHLEEACRVMVARVAAASKCREKCKKPEKPILSGDPMETLLLYVTLYPLCHCLPPLLLHPQKGKQHQMGKTQQQICQQSWTQESLRLQQPHLPQAQ
jgi:hypothetical protein